MPGLGDIYLYYPAPFSTKYNLSWLYNFGLQMTRQYVCFQNTRQDLEFWRILCLKSHQDAIYEWLSFKYPRLPPTAQLIEQSRQMQQQLLLQRVEVQQDRAWIVQTTEQASKPPPPLGHPEAALHSQVRMHSQRKREGTPPRWMQSQVRTRRQPQLWL